MEIVPGVLTRETPVRQRTPSMDRGWRINSIDTEFTRAAEAGTKQVVLLDVYDPTERMFLVPLANLQEIYREGFARVLPDGHQRNPQCREYWVSPGEVARYEVVNVP